MGRAGLPDDLVGACLFLAFDAMSGWLTGATTDVDGGTWFGWPAQGPAVRMRCG